MLGAGSKSTAAKSNWARFVLGLASLFLCDLFVVFGIYFLLPNPYELVKGVTLERVSKNAKFRFTVGPKNKKYVLMSQIPKILPSALIYLEDAKFYDHLGFDIEEIQNAVYERMHFGKRLRGASTLSQQLVKNLYLSSDRTFRRKLLEALITIKMELHLNKSKILEIYLNSIDWGKGLFGISEAAQFYFQKAPRDLDLRESVFLASIVPNPARFSQLDESLIPKRFVRMQMMRAFEGLYHSGLISLSQYEDVILHPFGNRKEPEFDEEGQPE